MYFVPKVLIMFWCFEGINHALIVGTDLTIVDVKEKDQGPVVQN